MKTTYLLTGAIIATGLGAWLTFSQAQPVTAAPEDGALVEIRLPDNLSDQAQMGKRAFDAVCAACHGENAVGRDGIGPPLIHKIYEPSHHGDMSFYIAAERGVRAHHWRFGNMPAQNGLTRADLGAIVAYVREVQRSNGID
ncbi:c-type cytochrome [Puniceibacterium sediminis]|uniref:Cytochrome c n=1 Tax=Puniceibacterium sediminis TaxID=1608407 RepID=A0A238WWU4_9RHOB|nr:cytochrome c [Puniceibacterium sediminis]SNR50069.1 Cytochrome c [Puniceibacterium sediminis]